MSHWLFGIFDISKIRLLVPHIEDVTKMKIAVPLFRDRISPHFGASSEILLVEAQDGRITRKAIKHLGEDDPGPIIRRLVSFGVDRIVCGGIQRAHKRWLIDNGIQVVDNQKGPAEELVAKMIASEFIHEHR